EVVHGAAGRARYPVDRARRRRDHARGRERTATARPVAEATPLSRGRRGRECDYRTVQKHRLVLFVLAVACGDGAAMDSSGSSTEGDPSVGDFSGSVSGDPSGSPSSSADGTSTMSGGTVTTSATSSGDESSSGTDTGEPVVCMDDCVFVRAG